MHPLQLRKPVEISNNYVTDVLTINHYRSSAPRDKRKYDGKQDFFFLAHKITLGMYSFHSERQLKINQFIMLLFPYNGLFSLRLIGSAMFGVTFNRCGNCPGFFLPSPNFPILQSKLDRWVKNHCQSTRTKSTSFGPLGLSTWYESISRWKSFCKYLKPCLFFRTKYFPGPLRNAHVWT